jgi:cytochrome c biogenesis protein CcmG, thiol:disulfide interchange protein DsbE
LERDIYSRYKSRGFEILAICLNDNEDAIKSAIAPFNLTYRVLTDRGGMTARTYKVTSIPMSLIIDKKGIIRYRKVGYDPSAMMDVIDKLL